jgi:RHS repeat-associated protein
LVFDNSGIIIGSQDYTGFGSLVASSGSGLDRYGYTGREWDNTLSLQYSRARIYDPATGRFLSADPLGFSAGDINLYRYVANSPTNASDPSGHILTFIAGGFAGVFVNGLANGFRTGRWDWDTLTRGWFGAFVGGAFGTWAGRGLFGWLTGRGVDPRRALPWALAFGAMFGYVTDRFAEGKPINPWEEAGAGLIGWLFGNLLNKLTCPPRQQPGNQFLQNQAKPNEAPPVGETPPETVPPNGIRPKVNPPSTTKPSTNAPTSKFSDSGFDTEVLPGDKFTQFYTTYNGPNNAGRLLVTFKPKRGDLYIDVIKSEVPKQGLGKEMLRKTIAEVEEQFGAGSVKQISGNLEGVNRTEFLANGLEATPAYKLREAMGFTEVKVQPSESNGYKLVMRRPN